MLNKTTDKVCPEGQVIIVDQMLLASCVINVSQGIPVIAPNFYTVSKG